MEQEIQSDCERGQETSGPTMLGSLGSSAKTQRRKPAGILTDIDIARACHEANRLYCQILGDNSQPPWESAPSWQMDSCIMGVRSFLASPPYSSPNEEASHNSWMEQKLRDGWRYGPVKDVEKKEHPCLLPFKSLPKEQQVKDALFLGICRALTVIE